MKLGSFGKTSPSTSRDPCRQVDPPLSLTGVSAAATSHLTLEIVTLTTSCLPSSHFASFSRAPSPPEVKLRLQRCSTAPTLCARTGAHPRQRRHIARVGTLLLDLEPLDSPCLLARSASLLIAYVMQKHKLSFGWATPRDSHRDLFDLCAPRRAMTYVQDKRFCINPSESFQQQLHVRYTGLLLTV